MRPERGSGVIGTTSALALFLLLLLFAVQVTIALHTRSFATGAAYDAARRVAGHGSAVDRDAAIAAATAEFQRRLGEYGDDARLEWLRVDDELVRVRVIAPHPTLLPRALVDAVGVGVTDRVLEVRVERFR